MFSLRSSPRTTTDIAGEDPSVPKPARARDTRLFLLERTRESSFEDSYLARDKAERYRIRPDFDRCSCVGDSHLLGNIYWTIFQSPNSGGDSIRGEHEIVPGLCLALYV